MRGKQVNCEIKRAAHRITPADAGKTERYDRPPKHGEDHPRGCGENRHFDAGFAVKIGSPPRMRGKQSRGPERFAPIRITPADAGKTRVRNAFTR